MQHAKSSSVVADTSSSENDVLFSDDPGIEALPSLDLDLGGFDAILPVEPTTLDTTSVLMGGL